jgi:integrase
VYLSFLELKGVTKSHLKQVEIYLKNYKKYILSVIDKQKNLEYFKELQRKNSVAYYKRQIFQLRRILKFLKVDWADEITLPADLHYNPIRISSDAIKKTFDYFNEDDTFIRLKAVILLGCSSGLRSTEIYNLTEDDIDLNNNMIIVKHDPKNNHTKKTRVTFFSDEAKKAIEEYIKLFQNSNSGLRTLFAQKTLSRKFRKAPMRV